MALSRRDMIQWMASLGAGLTAGEAMAQGGVGQRGSGRGMGRGDGSGRGAMAGGRGMGPGGGAGRAAPVPLEGETWGLNGANSFGEYKQALMRAGKPIPPVAVSPDNPAIMYHEYLCGACGHCDEACLAQGV
ncbi:MAG: hypothetical protein Q4C47_09745, partial [Planctomycetia bacterium]|nr:hypothetical protein [Planctomycetia bacterium]